MRTGLRRTGCYRNAAARCVLLLIGMLILPPAACSLIADEKADGGSQVREVVVDVVARDRNGNPVAGLKEQDVEISEDGVKQKITGVRLVERGSRPRVASADPLENVRLVTMIFQNQFTSPEGQSVARMTVNEFLKFYTGGDTVVGMFTLDKRFCIVQPYTNRKELLSEALDKAIARDTEPLQRASESIRKALASAASGASVSPPDLGGTGDPARDARLAQLTTRILTQTDARANDQGGWRTVLFSLQSVAEELKAVPGRKTVLYFAWGLWIPRENIDQVSELQSIANRAHVSIYPVYLAGLSSWSQARSAAEALKNATAASKSESSGGAVRTWGATASQAGESAINANALEALSNLGKATSGMLMGDSNDFTTPMEALHKDISNYYEITYTPQNANYDGKYRRIAVKIPKAKTILARNGYLAVADPGPAGLLPYESALMAVLSGPAPPHSFDYRLSVPRFENRNGVARHAVVMEVPLLHFSFVEDPGTKKVQCKFALLALVRDDAGQVAAKVSQSYPLDVPPGRVEEYRKSSLFLSREVRLAPGKYTVEAVAYDNAAEKGSVVKVPLEVPAAGNGVQVSSLSIIKKVEALAAGDTDTGNPFRLGDRKITPFAEDPVSMKVGSPLRFFVVVYPDPLSRDKAGMELHVMQGGSSLGAIPIELPAADAEGRIHYAGTLPTDSFAPGSYELKLVVTQGGTRAETRAGLVLIQ